MHTKVKTLPDPNPSQLTANTEFKTPNPEVNTPTPEDLYMFTRFFLVFS